MEIQQIIILSGSESKSNYCCVCKEHNSLCDCFGG